MPRKTSEQNQIKFLFGEDSLSKLSDEAEYIKKNEAEYTKKNAKTDEQLAEKHKSKKLNSKADESKLTHSIMSAARGEEMDIKSSNKFIGQTNSSIWGEKKISEKQDIVDDPIKEALKAEEVAAAKRKKDIERMGNVPISGKGSIDKGTLTNLFGEKDNGSYKYQSPKGNISIFEDGEAFDKLAEKTSGEIISQEKNNEKTEKDESWRNGQVKTTKSLFDNLFE